MPQHYLGIDIGTTAIKALVVDEFGSVAGVGESPLEISVPMPGWAEQDPSDWWQGHGQSGPRRVHSSKRTGGHVYRVVRPDA